MSKKIKCYTVCLIKQLEGIVPALNCLAKDWTENNAGTFFPFVKNTRHLLDCYFGKQNRLGFFLNSCKYMHVIYQEGWQAYHIAEGKGGKGQMKLRQSFKFHNLPLRLISLMFSGCVCGMVEMVNLLRWSLRVSESHWQCGPASWLLQKEGTITQWIVKKKQWTQSKGGPQWGCGPKN